MPTVVVPRRVCRLSFNRRFLSPARGRRWREGGVTSLFESKFFFASRSRRREEEEEWKWISIVIRSDRSRGKRTSLGYQPTNSFATVLHTLTNRGNNENNFSPSFSPLNDSHCALVPAPDFFGCRAARNGGGGGGSLPCPAEIGERRVASLGYCVYVSGMTVRLSARN